MTALHKLRRAFGHQDLAFAAGMMALVAVLLLPMPTWLDAGPGRNWHSATISA